VAEARRARVQGLVAERAGARGAALSAGDACEVAGAVSGADGAWLTVMSDPARRELAHATGGRAAELEELQFTVGEGPCVDAFTAGAPVLVSDLNAAVWGARWPGFAVAAQEAGASAVFAFPLVQGAIRIGVLGLYRATPGPLSPEGLADVLVCADTALQLLLSTRSGANGDGQLDGEGWGGHHARVYQATGMVSVQSGAGLEESLALLRAFAFAHDLPLGEVAERVVARQLRLDPGAADEPAT
jgi:GAF domain